MTNYTKNHTRNATNRAGLPVLDEYGIYRMPSRQPLSAKEAIRAVREMGMAVTCSSGEYRLTFPFAVIAIKHPQWSRYQHLDRLEQVAYYTDSIDDLINTAAEMRSQEYNL